MPTLNSLFIPLAVLGMAIINSLPVKANENTSYPDYQFYCGQSNSTTHTLGRKCDRFLQKSHLVITEEPTAFIFQDKTRNLRYQKSYSNDTGVADYLVTTILGVYFPTLETLKPESGGSFFGGIKLKENIRLDAEIVGVFEGNTVEKAYFDKSIFISLRFSLPLSAKESYPFLYFSPGVGISEIDRQNETDEDEDSLPTLQVEGGVSLPIHRNIGGYGGIKYVNQPSGSGDNLLGAECGITLKL